jgi:hypothetical protein
MESINEINSENIVNENNNNPDSPNETRISQEALRKLSENLEEILDIRLKLKWLDDELYNHYQANNIDLNTNLDEEHNQELLKELVSFTSQ